MSKNLRLEALTLALTIRDHPHDKVLLAAQEYYDFLTKDDTVISKSGMVTILSILRHIRQSTAEGTTKKNLAIIIETLMR